MRGSSGCTQTERQRERQRKRETGLGDRQIDVAIGEAVEDAVCTREDGVEGGGDACEGSGRLGGCDQRDVACRVGGCDSSNKACHTVLGMHVRAGEGAFLFDHRCVFLSPVPHNLSQVRIPICPVPDNPRPSTPDPRGTCVRAKGRFTFRVSGFGFRTDV
jgi:hypothetical protein